MARLLGILSGSAIAVVLLIVLLGVPDIAPEEIAAELPPEPAAVSLPEIEEAPQPAISEPEPQVQAPPPEEIAVSPEVDESTNVAVPQEVVVEHWYAFWSPFNSRLAADGFVAQLQRTTGLDYRVVKLKPGVYEVAFSYADETDIETKLAQISSATGLDMPGS